MTPINQLFKIRYGSHGYDNKSVLDEGKTLLIASQGVDNGAFGFFDVPQKYQEPVISVPRTGSTVELRCILSRFAFGVFSRSNISS